jgi:CDP-glycerol glycerophosphotransferase (TagB/SpsB family)
MCLLCDDEKAYKAYMDFLDLMEKQGKTADPNQAIDAVLDQLEALDAARAKENAKENARENAKRNMNPWQDDPANDKTLSPFFCSPINK